MTLGGNTITGEVNDWQASRYRERSSGKEEANRNEAQDHPGTALSPDDSSGIPLGARLQLRADGRNHHGVRETRSVQGDVSLPLGGWKNFEVHAAFARNVERAGQHVLHRRDENGRRA